MCVYIELVVYLDSFDLLCVTRFKQFVYVCLGQNLIVLIFTSVCLSYNFFGALTLKRKLRLK